MFDEQTRLSLKAREQVALGVSVAVNCQPCFMYHLQKYRNLGGDNEEIMEIIKLARRTRSCTEQEMEEFIVKALNEEDITEQFKFFNEKWILQGRNIK